MPQVLVAYATQYGSTHEVAEAIAQEMRDRGLEVVVEPARQVKNVDTYAAVVLGAPLYMFHWHKDALRFLFRYRVSLMARPVAIFALGPVHDPHDEKEWQDSNAQLEKELAQFPWLKPVALEMLGGKYDPAKLGFPLKMFAGKVPASDIRDWTAVRAWARELASKLQSVVARKQLAGRSPPG